MRLFSLLGFLPLAYPEDQVVAFNRTELEPWWGAWAPAILALVLLGMTGGLMLIWAVLATVYFLPAWLLGFFANRAVSFGGSWRLAGAALLPGALFMCGALVLYGFGALDLVRLAVAVGVHFIIGWGYVIASPFWLPRHPAAKAGPANPFNKAEVEPLKH